MPTEVIALPRATCRIHHERAYEYDPKTGLYLYRIVEEDEVCYNLVTDAGRVQLHTFCYGTVSRTNGLNFIGLSNDSSTPGALDTVLTGELTANGLGRAQGTVTLPTGAANQTQVQRMFTYTGVASQGVRKTALFNVVGPPPAGVMAHEIQFTQRTLYENDTLTVTFTITLG